MVQNQAKRRGRPRAYDPEVALARATDVFWSGGYSGTSLDDLATAMAMNRPSVYAAFGDKRDLYMATVRRYQAEMRAAVRPFFDGSLGLRLALRRIYDVAVRVYSGGPAGPRGCYTIGTAVTESTADPEVRQLLLDWMHESDGAFTRLIGMARERGELPDGADASALGILAVATLHTLAVRARAGAAAEELEAVVAAAIRTICGPEPARRARPHRR
jgi:AcrR family transcriptional regulator